MKSQLSKFKYASRETFSNAVPNFFEYGADVLAHLTRGDVDKLQLALHRWNCMLEGLRISLPLRPLCVESYVVSTRIRLIHSFSERRILFIDSHSKLLYRTRFT